MVSVSHHMTDTNYLTQPKIFSSEFCGNADMPFDFFMSRYKEAYVLETLVSCCYSVRVRRQG